MTTVILGNQLGPLKPVLKGTSGPLRFLRLTDSPDLAVRVKAWARGARVKAVDRIRAAGTLRRFLKLSTPAGIGKT